MYKSEIITLYEENTALKKKNIDLNKINKNLIIQLNKKKKEIDLLNKQLQNINDKLNKLENINNKLNNKLNDNDLHIENIYKGKNISEEYQNEIIKKEFKCMENCLKEKDNLINEKQKIINNQFHFIEQLKKEYEKKEKRKRNQ